MKQHVVVIKKKESLFEIVQFAKERSGRSADSLSARTGECLRIPKLIRAFESKLKNFEVQKGLCVRALVQKLVIQDVRADKAVRAPGQRARPV